MLLVNVNMPPQAQHFVLDRDGHDLAESNSATTAAFRAVSRRIAAAGSKCGRQGQRRGGSTAEDCEGQAGLMFYSKETL